MDARNVFTQVDRAHRKFSDEQIKNLGIITRLYQGDTDGLDSNGSIKMSGGVVHVDGPTNNGNGALDYDNNFNVTGGSLIIYGAAGILAAGLLIFGIVKIRDRKIEKEIDKL